MKKLLALAAPILLCFASVAHADGFSVQITVDENGHGTFTNSTGFHASLPGYMAADPGPGGLSSVLTYSLLNPPGLVSGDVLLSDGGLVLDVVRFNASNGTLAFYSDNIDGFDDLADTFGPPTEFYLNRVTIAELGLEGGGDGAVYTPIAGQPGYVAGAAGPVTYHLISDTAPVPEPSSIALLGTGLIGALGAARRRFLN